MSSETKKETTTTKHKPMKVIRQGAIAASIWRRQTSTGFEYLDFSLSRSWKLKSGEKEGYSQSFFEGNEEAIVEVVAEACAFIRAEIGVDSEPPKAKVNGVAARPQVDLA